MRGKPFPAATKPVVDVCLFPVSVANMYTKYISSLSFIGTGDRPQDPPLRISPVNFGHACPDTRSFFVATSHTPCYPRQSTNSPSVCGPNRTYQVGCPAHEMCTAMQLYPSCWGGMLLHEENSEAIPRPACSSDHLKTLRAVALPDFSPSVRPSACNRFNVCDFFQTHSPVP